jgi:hypothetical protein
MPVKSERAQAARLMPKKQMLCHCRCAILRDCAGILKRRGGLGSLGSIHLPANEPVTPLTARLGLEHPCFAPKTCYIRVWKVSASICQARRSGGPLPF